MAREVSPNQINTFKSLSIPTHVLHLHSHILLFSY